MTRWRAASRLVAPEVVGVAEVRQHDLVAVRQVGQQLPRGVCGGVAMSSVAADQQRLDVASRRTRLYALLVGVGGPGVDAAAPPAQTKSVPGAADDRVAARLRARSSAARRAASVRADRGDVAPDLNDSRERPARPSATGTRAPLGSPCAAGEPACRASSAPRAAPAAERRRPSGRRTRRPRDVALLDRQEPPAAGMSRGGLADRARRGRRVRPRQACVLRAQRRVALRSARRSSRVPEEVARAG